MYYHMSQNTMVKFLFAKDMLYKVTGKSINVNANEFVKDFIQKCASIDDANLRTAADGLLEALLIDNDDSLHLKELQSLHRDLEPEDINLFKDDWLGDEICFSRLRG